MAALDDKSAPEILTERDDKLLPQGLLEDHGRLRSSSGMPEDSVRRQKYPKLSLKRNQHENMNVQHTETTRPYPEVPDSPGVISPDEPFCPTWPKSSLPVLYSAGTPARSI